MAAKHVLVRVRYNGMFRLSLSHQGTRGYARKINEEDMIAYNKFRKEFTAHRRKFMDEWKEEKRKENEMKAERDRIDRENERKQSKSIAGEDEKLEVKRKAYFDAKAKRMDEKRERGDAIREEMTADRKAFYIQQIQERTEEMKEFITFDNLDQKVKEAVDNVHSFTYALNQSGKRVELNKGDIYYSDYQEFLNSTSQNK